MSSLSIENFDAKPDRITIVDSLRGFALFGILLSHLILSFDGGALPHFNKVSNFPYFDVFITIFNNLFIKGKFFTIFSFLFGVSFSIQIFKKGNFKTNLLRYAWRLIILGVLGFLHGLFWRGDILLIYAILGFIIMLVINLPDKWLVILSFVLILNIPGRIINFDSNIFKPQITSVLPKESLEDEQHLKYFYSILKTGSFKDLVISNLYEIKPKLLFQSTGRMYITLGFMMLGLYVGRKKIFNNLNAHEILIKKIFLISLIAGVLTLIFVISSKESFKSPLLNFIREFIRDLNHFSFSILYITGTVLLYIKNKFTDLFTNLAMVGRMALTNYILQSIIGGFIFFGYGFGLIGDLPAFIAFLLIFPIFVIQIYLSEFWLTRFKYGPLEWVWRSLTYLKFQDMRK